MRLTKVGLLLGDCRRGKRVQSIRSIKFAGKRLSWRKRECQGGASLCALYSLGVQQVQGEAVPGRGAGTIGRYGRHGWLQVSPSQRVVAWLSLSWKGAILVPQGICDLPLLCGTLRCSTAFCTLPDYCDPLVQTLGPFNVYHGRATAGPPRLRAELAWL